MSPTRRPATSLRAQHYRGFQKERRQRMRHAVGFTPLQISSLISWYDYADASTLYIDTSLTTQVSADGNEIQSVRDKGPGGKNLALPAGADGALYKVGIQGGKSVGRYSAARADYLDGLAAHNLSQPNTIFAVAIVGAETAQNNLFACPAGDQNALYIKGVTSVAGMFAGTALESAVVVDDGVVRIWCGLFNGASSKLYINGGSAAASGAAGAQTIATAEVGAGAGASKLTGDLGEILIYNAALSVAQINDVGGYLASKWAATWAVAS